MIAALHRRTAFFTLPMLLKKVRLTISDETGKLVTLHHDLVVELGVRRDEVHDVNSVGVLHHRGRARPCEYAKGESYVLPKYRVVG